MPIYTVTLLGKSFLVDAENNYQARRIAAEEYKKISPADKPAVLRAMCTVKVKEEFDKRVKYPNK